MATGQGTEFSGSGLSSPMRVVLSFDIEVWCDGWDHLDASFPAAFKRYVYGRSVAGDYALPMTLEILRRHGLQGVFFVEPLFAARFGIEPLQEIVGLIRAAGQEVQLHLHPEWSDEIKPRPFPGADVKRQHLCYYSLAEQIQLIALGRDLLSRAGGGLASAFRAGSYAANADTFTALRANGITLDSSLNPCFAISGQDLPVQRTSNQAIAHQGVQGVPVSVYQDGLGRLRPAQLSAAGLTELQEVLSKAQVAGQTQFVMVSHNFELLKPGSSNPDWTMVRRFDALCEHLASHPQAFQVGALTAPDLALTHEPPLPKASMQATLRRYAEQMRRRF